GYTAGPRSPLSGILWTTRSRRARPPHSDNEGSCRMGMRLEAKTALVTGATSNIGRAIATAFSAEGAHVVVSGRSRERGGEVLDEIRASGGRADFVAAH